eukprot:gnl/TRDRNA2_/TRDRNA2_188153_c0_seq1.p1 gnl/TRDRNA2_/TRDRNA2_188153_c0~~gnl/TRDRNA2_/TRDRNA2_188153_c0_seq1.p1  ORF type:complete len:583 (+),score=40.19 gnl/TRDRNA2_/TRDRNA2_188153_c0_seq1:1-1749(+)
MLNQNIIGHIRCKGPSGGCSGLKMAFTVLQSSWCKLALLRWVLIAASLADARDAAHYAEGDHPELHEEWMEHGEYEDEGFPEEWEWIPHGENHCSPGYMPYGDGCYWVSEEKGTFTQCQTEICANEGGTLASIYEDGLDEFLWELIIIAGDTSQYGTFIGFFQDITTNVDDWEWVNGSQVNYENWHDGMPHAGMGCATVACAAMIPTCFWCEDPTTPRYRGWDAVSCVRERHCLCQEDSRPSQSYLKSLGNLNWPGFLTFIQPIYLGMGWPCLFSLVWALLGTLSVTQRPTDHPGQVDFLSTSANANSYGPLLATSRNALHVDSLVHSLVLRGGRCAVIYGVVLLALSFTTAIQNQEGATLRVIVNAFEAIVMFVCKLTVGISAMSVHRHLSPTSRAMAGPWIWILSVSKILLALGAFLTCCGYLHLWGTFDVCAALNLFTISCIIYAVFQSLAGFALFRVYYRTVRRVGDREIFSRVIGCWWSTLVGSTFGVGIGWWWCGARWLTDNQDIPYLLALAAICELVAGASMLRANKRIRYYFRSAEGKAKFAEVGARMMTEIRREGDTQLRERVGRPYGGLREV